MSNNSMTSNKHQPDLQSTRGSHLLVLFSIIIIGFSNTLRAKKSIEILIVNTWHDLQLQPGHYQWRVRPYHLRHPHTKSEVVGVNQYHLLFVDQQ
jgi:hypothetical protein